MERNINLDIDTIFNKEFSVDFKGYSMVEVDQFLDLVAQDYDRFDRHIADLKEKLDFYLEENDQLKARVIDLESKLAKAQEEKANSTLATAPVNNLSQVDILRRIARLEQEVFNRK